MSNDDARYIAYIYEPEVDDDCTTAVDIRTLDDRLIALRAEAAQYGDGDLVALIDSLAAEW